MSGRDVEKREGKTGRSVPVVGIVVAILVVWFAVTNFQDVEVKFFFVTTTMPLFIVIVGTLLIGIAGGYLAGRRRRRPRD
jgi:LPXTG-motif cell wall-anchored protein